MAHRGRLNVLVNTLHKTYDQIFTEFDEAWIEDFLDRRRRRQVPPRLLECDFTRPRPARRCASRSRRTRRTWSSGTRSCSAAPARSSGCATTTERTQCVPILIHGDAAFPGQGIVAECFNMSKLDGYTRRRRGAHRSSTTRSASRRIPSDAHSGRYCTDIAKMVEAPIFHVNGDDPEACAWVSTTRDCSTASSSRRDVVIDMWCYRKFGHNEGDEPSFTQPLMYERDREPDDRCARSTSTGSIAEGVDDAGRVRRAGTRRAEATGSTRRRPGRRTTTRVDPTSKAFKNVWAGLTEDLHDDSGRDTGVDRERTRTRQYRARHAAGRVHAPQEAASGSCRSARLGGGRAAARSTGPWARLLAYGSLLCRGSRGAAHRPGRRARHLQPSPCGAVRPETGAPYTPLNDIAATRRKFCVHNSPLTESACLGFEYGYSLGDPNMLVIWEAQFGDFANGAQVIFDQFISSAEIKWKPLQRPRDACSPTATRARAPSIRRPASSASCTLCAGTTSRSPTRRRRRRCSTCSGVR